MKITYARIRKAMKGENYPMTLVGRDAEVVQKAVNAGIDARLEACFVPDRGDAFQYITPMDIKPCARFPNGASLGTKLQCSVSPDSLPVLLRRLTENMEYTGDDGDDADVGGTLATDILNGLGINCETAAYSIVSGKGGD